MLQLRVIKITSISHSTHAIILSSYSCTSSYSIILVLNPILQASRRVTILNYALTLMYNLALIFRLILNYIALVSVSFLACNHLISCYKVLLDKADYYVASHIDNMRLMSDMYNVSVLVLSN